MGGGGVVTAKNGKSDYPKNGKPPSTSENHTRVTIRAGTVAVPCRQRINHSLTELHEPHHGTTKTVLKRGTNGLINSCPFSARSTVKVPSGPRHTVREAANEKSDSLSTSHVTLRRENFTDGSLCLCKSTNRHACGSPAERFSRRSLSRLVKPSRLTTHGSGGRGNGMGAVGVESKTGAGENSEFSGKRACYYIQTSFTAQFTHRRS